MKRDLQDKTIFITGASSGLGTAFARQCAARGARLLLAGRNKDRLTTVMEQCKTLGSSYVKIIVIDFEDAVYEPVAFFLEEEGGADVVINNAGFGLFERFEDTTTAEMKAMFQVNVQALFEVTKAVLPFMKKRGGHIINVASQAGKMATPKSSIYAATKHAVLGFSNALRLEVKQNGIFVTTVNPGPIATGFFTHADRAGTYEKAVSRYLLQADEVAEKTLRHLFTARREINLPWWMNAAGKAHALFPSFVEAVAKKGFDKK